MRTSAVMAGFFSLLLLAGCETPLARVATLQDTKHPVSRQSKIALPVNPQSQPDLATRLAGEALESQMRALGFNLVPAGEAEYVFTYTVAVKDVPESYTRSVPTISNTVGTWNGYPMSGTTFGEQVVPQTRMVSTIQCDASLQTMAEPKLTVWQGQISAPVEDQQKYNYQFYRALLERVGETFNGEVNLKNVGESAR